MSSDDEKPPAPPVRLTSNRSTDLVNSSIAVDRPLPKEPEDLDKKKKNLKSKKTHKLSTYASDKPNISYPTNFEHTVHVGFDPISGEFTVSFEENINKNVDRVTIEIYIKHPLYRYLLLYLPTCFLI